MRRTLIERSRIMQHVERDVGLKMDPGIKR